MPRAVWQLCLLSHGNVSPLTWPLRSQKLTVANEAYSNESFQTFSTASINSRQLLSKRNGHITYRGAYVSVGNMGIDAWKERLKELSDRFILFGFVFGLFKLSNVIYDEVIHSMFFGLRSTS